MKPMSLAEFDTLQDWDFKNAAVRAEIRAALQDREDLIMRLQESNRRERELLDVQIRRLERSGAEEEAIRHAIRFHKI